MSGFITFTFTFRKLRSGHGLGTFFTVFVFLYVPIGSLNDALGSPFGVVFSHPWLFGLQGGSRPLKSSLLGALGEPF